MNRQTIYNIFFGTFPRRALSYGIPFGMMMAFFISSDRPPLIALFTFLFTGALFGFSMAYTTKRWFDTVEGWAKEDSRVPAKRYAQYLKNEVIPDDKKDLTDFRSYLDTILARYQEQTEMASFKKNYSGYIFLFVIFIITLLNEQLRWLAIVYPAIAIIGISGYITKKKAIEKIERVRKKIDFSHTV